MKKALIVFGIASLFVLASATMAAQHATPKVCQTDQIVTAVPASGITVFAVIRTDNVRPATHFVFADDPRDHVTPLHAPTLARTQLLPPSPPLLRPQIAGLVALRSSNVRMM